MKTRSMLALVVAAIAGSAAWGRDVGYDFVACAHSRLTTLERNDDIVAFGLEQWVMVASSTTKEFERATARCLGYLRVVAGQQTGKGLCKYLLLNGDTAVGEWEMPETGEKSFKWLSGTGGLKGIATKDSGWVMLGNGKPAEPGTSQACRHDRGTYTLP